MATPANQKRIQSDVHDVLMDLTALLTELPHSISSADALRETLKSLEDQFLIVVVGEFNAGKSSFINALLQMDILEEGVTPTTAKIHLIRSGLQVHIQEIDDWGLLVRVPSALLENLSIVDTPGTNSVFPGHEQLTNWFYPRADLVLFLTSADRPFTESERVILRTIRQWGKKIVFIINKIDLLPDLGARENVITFVKDHLTRELGESAPVFVLSSRMAKNCFNDTDRRCWEESGFAAIETFIHEKLSETERFYLKMDSALSLARKTCGEIREIQTEELEFYRADDHLCEEILAKTRDYQMEMQHEVARSLKEISAIFAMIRTNGGEFFEDMFKFRNIPNILKKDKNQIEFQDKVLHNLPTEVERKMNETVDAIYRNQQKLTHFTSKLIEQRKTGFPCEMISETELKERSSLIQKMQLSVDDMVSKIEHGAAGEIGMKHVQNAVTAGLAIEVSAIGLGAGLTILATTVATDILGIVAAFWVGIAGFLVLPYYRKKAQKEFDEKISEVEQKLINSLDDELNNEVNLNCGQIGSTVAPFRQFVHAAMERLNLQRKRCLDIESRAESLQKKTSIINLS